MPYIAMQRATPSVQIATSSAVCGMHMGLPVVPDEQWKRFISDMGAAVSPSGYSSRRSVAQVRLLHERELREVRERHEVARLHSLFVAAAAEERDMLVLVGDEVLQFRELQLAQLVYGHEVGL